MSKPKFWGVVSPLPAPVVTMQAKMAEDAGLEGVFAPQVYGPPFIPLAAAAVVTQRVRLASGIAWDCPVTSVPYRLAQIVNAGRCGPQVASRREAARFRRKSRSRRMVRGRSGRRTTVEPSIPVWFGPSVFRASFQDSTRGPPPAVSNQPNPPQTAFGCQHTVQ